MTSNCNDCGKVLKMASDKMIRESTRMGIYYQGPPICDKCGAKKYEEAVSLHEDLKGSKSE